jgi:hypothetical protein
LIPYSAELALADEISLPVWLRRRYPGPYPFSPSLTFGMIH